MKKLLLILDGLLSDPDGLDLLREEADVLQHIAVDSTVGLLRREPKLETPELAWVGLDPSTQSVSQGVLTVSALGKDPPPRSVHFHLSLASLQEGAVTSPPPPSEDEAGQLKTLISKLDTRMLTTIWGENLDHALVWEDGSIDLGTTALVEANGKQFPSVLPEGDGELQLRRLIDDSVNLFSDLDLNRRREDEGIAPLNLLWPWGQGFRPRLDNLAVQRGQSALYESRSLRMDGLARLVGYRHGPRASMGKGLVTNWARIQGQEASNLAVLDESLGTAVAAGRPEEGAAFLESLEQDLLEPVALAKDTVLLVTATDGRQGGIWLQFDPRQKTSNTLPFDGRLLEESRAPSAVDWELVDKHLRP